jgi:hypothetical protein
MKTKDHLTLTSPSLSQLSGGSSSVIASYLDASSSATLGSRSSTVLKLRRSYSLNRESHHAGLAEAPKSLSQLRHDLTLTRNHPLSRSLPTLSTSSGGSAIGSSVGLFGATSTRRRRRRQRTGLQPAPRTKAEKELLYEGRRGTIFSKYKPQAGLPQRKLTTKGTHPAGFAGVRAAKATKLYKLQANNDADAIRAYHTMSGTPRPQKVVWVVPAGGLVVTWSFLLVPLICRRQPPPRRCTLECLI